MNISIEINKIHDLIMLDTLIDLWKEKWKADEAEEAEEEEVEDESEDTVSDSDTNRKTQEERLIKEIFRACGFVDDDDCDNDCYRRRKPRR